jgi:hypothetical protein
MLSYFVLALLLVNADTVSLQELRRISADLFRVEAMSFEGRTVYSQSVAVPGEHHPLASFARENRSLLTYLSQHGSNVRLTVTLAGVDSDVERQMRYSSALLSDSAFAAAYLPFAARYLEAQGVVVTGLDRTSHGQPRAIRRSEMMRVAVRFFSPFLNESGGVATHVCTAFNDVRDLPGPRDIMLEAFAYAAISAEMRPDAPPRFVDDFGAARRLMNSLALSTDQSVKLDRARGVMWGVMGQSKALADVLLEAYGQRAAYLPFQLTD